MSFRNLYRPDHIEYQDIAAWARLTGRCPSPWEVDTMMAIDAAFHRVCEGRDVKPEQDAEAIAKSFRSLMSSLGRKGAPATKRKAKR